MQGEFEGKTSPPVPHPRELMRLQELDGRGRPAPRALPAAPERGLCTLRELDGRGRAAPRAVPEAPDRGLSRLL